MYTWALPQILEIRSIKVVFRLAMSMQCAVRAVDVTRFHEDTVSMEPTHAVRAPTAWAPLAFRIDHKVVAVCLCNYNAFVYRS